MDGAVTVWRVGPRSCAVLCSAASCMECPDDCSQAPVADQSGCFDVGRCCCTSFCCCCGGGSCGAHDTADTVWAVPASSRHPATCVSMVRTVCSVCMCVARALMTAAAHSRGPDYSTVSLSSPSCSQARADFLTDACFSSSPLLFEPQ